MDVFEVNKLKCREELLRAPSRKRKTLEECNKPRIIRMMWDTETESTSAMMEELGMSMLGEDDTAIEAEGPESCPKPTPPTTFTDQLNPPGAPKVGALATQSNVTVTSYADPSLRVAGPRRMSPIMMYIDPQGTTDLAMFSKLNAGSHNGFDPWLLLCDELVLAVFTWLPKSTLVRCACVCRRWNTLAFDETLWRRLDLANKTLQRGVLGRVLDRGVAVLRLARAEIEAPLSLCNPMFSRPRLCRLQYLDASLANMSTRALEELLMSCQLLRKLSLENCEINSIIARYIGQNKNLEVLNLCMSSGVTENALVPISNNLLRLDALNVAWTNMSRGAVVYLVISLPPCLTKLNLSGCRDTLQDDDVQQLCGSCPGLKELDLSDNTALTAQSIQHIVSTLLALEYLALSRCYRIVPSSLASLGQLRCLLAVDVFGMLKEPAVVWLTETLSNIEINKFPFSSIARPTTGIRRTSIWGLRVRDSAL